MQIIDQSPLFAPTAIKLDGRRVPTRHISRDADESSIVDLNAPIVVQHTRLNSRQAENALISTIAFGVDR
jgi:hypothetical protein